MSRRAGAICAAFVLTAMMLATSFHAYAGAAATQLTFTVWTFAVDTIQDNIKRFQQRTPGVTVQLTDYNWGQYNDTIVANFAGGSSVPDVLYSSDHWLQQWAAAGWIAPLDDYFPKARELAKAFAPYAVEGMTYRGKLYGFPYYADPMGFMYNAAILRKAGFGAPPETWAQVLEQAKAIKAKGLVQYPIGFGFSLQEPFSIETFIAMVYSQGGNLFDQDLRPVFNQPGSPTIKTIEWIRDALKAGVMNPETLQWDGVQAGDAMKAGTQVFYITRASGLWELNNPTFSKEAGKFQLAVMPGSTHQTVGFVRFYAMSRNVPRRGREALDAAWQFLNYFGGPGADNTYPVVRRWALDFGLGFAQMPLFKDKEIRAAFGRWVNVERLEAVGQQARAKQGLTPWFAQWDVFARAELQKAYLAQQTPEQTAQNLAAMWNQLARR